MSDDRYGQVPPESHPQQGGMAPPPAYGQQPVAAPPKKRRTALIIGLVAGTLLLCGFAGCVGLIAVGASGDGEQRKILEQADAHYGAAMSAVETAGVELKDAGDGSDTAKVTAAIDDANKAMRTGRDEIAAARASAETLDDSQGKADYLASLSAADEALDALQDLVAYMGTTAGMAGKVTEAGNAATKAAGELDAAIEAGNAEDYGGMKAKAQSAASGYAQAAKLFRDAAAFDAAAGLDKAAAYCDKSKEQADLAVKMAGEGKAGNAKAYNADIKQMEQLRKQAGAIGDPEIVEDPEWLEKRLAELETRITTAGEKADELHVKAVEALTGE